MKKIIGFTKFNKELLDILTKIKSTGLMGDFLADILTPNEYDNIVTRLQIIKQLDAGIPQREIAKNLGVSIAKITRGAREMLNKTGGFKQVLKLLREKKI